MYDGIDVLHSDLPIGTFEVALDLLREPGADGWEFFISARRLFPRTLRAAPRRRLPPPQQRRDLFVDDSLQWGKASSRTMGTSGTKHKSTSWEARVANAAKKPRRAAHELHDADTVRPVALGLRSRGLDRPRGLGDGRHEARSHRSMMPARGKIGNGSKSPRHGDGGRPASMA